MGRVFYDSPPFRRLHYALSSPEPVGLGLQRLFRAAPQIGHDVSWQKGKEAVVGQPVPSAPQQETTAHLGQWRLAAATLCVSLGFCFFFFRETISTLVGTWLTSRTYSHCFLIIPLFAALIWIRRRALLACAPSTRLWGLVVLAVSALGWLIGRIADAREIEQFALVAVICSMIWMLLGTRVVHIIRFPLAFLFFAVPFGASLIAPLQDYTAWFAVHALTLSNVPAVLDGRTISLPDSSWTVAETCSGIRYLFASIVLALVFGSLMYRSRRRQLIFLAASIIVPILANGVRAYGIVLLGYLTDNKLATGVDHVIYGLIFFCSVQLILLAGGLRWRESSFSGDRVAASNGHAPSQKPAKTLLLALAAVLVMMVAPLWAGRLWNQSAAAGELERAAVSVDSSWQPAETSDTSWTPDLRGFDEEFRQSYRSGGNQVDLWMAFYSGKRGMQFVGSTNRLSDPKLGLVVSTSMDPAVVGGVKTVLNQSLLQFGSRYRAVWTVYWVDGVYTASPARVKLLEAKARLLGRSPAAMVLAVSSEERVDHPMSMSSVLQDFMAHVDFSVIDQPLTTAAAGMDAIGKDRSNTSAIR